MTGPRPDVNRLAELDADIAAGLPADPAAPADPASRAVLDALAATRAELGSLPPVPLPPEVAARWSAALAAEHATQPGRPGGRARRTSPWRRFPRTGGRRVKQDRRRGASAATSGRERTEPAITPSSPARRGRTRPAIAVGLALVALLLLAGALRSRPPDVTAARLGGVAMAAVGAHDAGELADPVRREACLRAVAPPGLRPDAQLVGGRGVEFEGRPGILLVMGTGRLGSFRVVVVDPGCGPGGGELLADTVVGR